MSFNGTVTRIGVLGFFGVLLGLLVPIGVQTAPSQDVYRSFDLIYYSRDSAFAGRSNFREPAGKRELSTEQRLQYLDLLAARLVREAGPLADAYVIDKAALDAARAGLAPLPLPKSRAVQPLVFWSWQIDIDNQAQDKWSEETFDDSLWNPVKAPYVRDVPADLWFRTRFTRPANPRVYLEAEQILDDCRVWVNGRLAGRHQGYGPFRLDITELVKRSGDNVLAIQVPWKPGDQVGLGGRMSIIGTAPQILEAPFFYTEALQFTDKGAEADVAVECQVRNTDQAPFTGAVRASLLAPVGLVQAGPVAQSQEASVTLKPGEATKVRLVIKVPGARLWTPDQPNLYEARLVLAEPGGAARDDLALLTGLRTIEQRNGRFFLNNRPFFMVGFLDTLTYPPRCLVGSHSEVAPSDEQIIQTLVAVKKANANIVRVHPLGMRNSSRHLANGRPPMEAMTDQTNYARYAEIADQLGITLVWGTRFLGFQMSFLEGDKERQLRDDLPASIEWVRNHPSIIAYEGMNEVSGSLSSVKKASPGPKVEAQIGRYVKIRSEYIRTVSQTDPTRLINPDASWSDPDNHLEPVIPGEGLSDPRIYSSIHLYCGWYDPITSIWTLPALTEAKGRSRALVVDEIGSEAMPNWALYEKERWYGIWMNNGNRYCSNLERDQIGRPLRVLESSEYQLSQAYQALLYYLYATALRNHGGDGFTICTLADGFTQGHYHKGAIDVYGRAKLGWVMARMLMDDYLVTGTDGDLVLCPADPVQIRVSRIGLRELRRGRLKVRLCNAAGKTLDEREFRVGPASFGVSPLVQWSPGFKEDGFYFLEYELD